MWFNIPLEHQGKPEALRLIALDDEFTKACAEEHKAVMTKLWKRDPTAFEALCGKVRQLQKDLKEATLVYDAATGEPKPLLLPSVVEAEIRELFDSQHQALVITILSKTLAHLQRQGVNDRRVVEGIVRLSGGDVERFTKLAQAAQEDYRDVLLSAQEHMS